MTDRFISFDDVENRIKHVLREIGDEAVPDGVKSMYLVRDLSGKVRLSVSEALEEDEKCRGRLQCLADAFSEVLGAHGYLPEDGVLYVGDALLETLAVTAQEIHPRVFLADRLVTGRDWWTVGSSSGGQKAARITLYSVKGGVGRSTTAAVLAWHLARRGERVLVIDMDLESPGLSSAMLEPERRPKFGVTDWFVEDLVGQGDCVVQDMLAVPGWAQDFDGDVRVAPAHGHDPGEYFAKLGRVYMDTAGEPWTQRLERLLGKLEATFGPTVVLLESRSGLHDIAAATVTDLDAEVLLFFTDAESAWTDYAILFRHWNQRELARHIRERLSVVSALTPAPDREAYMERFRPQAWDLFRDHLYDAVEVVENPGDAFSFDLYEEDAPHSPMEIGWTLGLAAGTSLREMDEETVKSAYGKFLESFDKRVYTGGAGDTM